MSENLYDIFPELVVFLEKVSRAKEGYFFEVGFVAHDHVSRVVKLGFESDYGIDMMRDSVKAYGADLSMAHVAFRMGFLEDRLQLAQKKNDTDRWLTYYDSIKYEQLYLTQSGISWLKAHLGATCQEGLKINQ